MIVVARKGRFGDLERLGVTGESPCYDPGAIVDRVSTVAKLGDIVRSATK